MRPDHSDYDISTRVLNSMDGEGLVKLHDKLHRTPYHMLKNRKITRSEIQGRILKKARNYKDLYDKLHEDVPTNAVGGGNIQGIGVGPKGEPGVEPEAMAKYKNKNNQEAPRPGRKTFSMFMQGK